MKSEKINRSTDWAVFWFNLFIHMGKKKDIDKGNEVKIEYI